MTAITFQVKLPVSNPLKFTRDGSPKNQRASFDQRSYAQVKNATTELGIYQQLYENADPCKFEFFTNFPSSRVRILDCDGEEVGDILFPGVEVEYRNKVYRADCKIASINGKLFIYFDEGVKYTDEDFTIEGDAYVLTGKLPAIQAVAGDLLTYSLNGVDFSTAPIGSIVWDPDLKAEGYLTDVDLILVEPVDGLVVVDYNQKPVDLYSQSLDFSALPEGVYYVKLEFGTGATFDLMTFTSEPIHIASEHVESLAIDYRHTGIFNKADKWNYVYADGEYNRLRLPADFFKYVPSGEIEEDVNDTGTPRLQQAVPFRELQLEARNIPGWLADKISMVLSHDTKVINGYQWVNDGFGTFETVDRMDIGTYTVNLRQKEDRTLFENEIEGLVEASWDPDLIEDIAFGGDDVDSTFNANVPGLFRFISVPAWITPSQDTFQNGDVITFTIAPNAVLLPRSAVLTAISDDYDGLEAQITIAQAYDTSVVEFIEASDYDVDLLGDAGSEVDVTVNASGPWEAINQSGHAFAFAIDGDTLTISEPTENSDDEDRIGVIRIRLVGNPAVFKDITVTQAPFDGLTNLSPSVILISPGNIDTEQLVDVTAQASCQWQASSAAWGATPGVNILEWLHFDTSVFTGTVIGFAIQCDAKPPYYPGGGASRIATVTFTNINNPSDQVILTIEQTD